MGQTAEKAYGTGKTVKHGAFTEKAKAEYIRDFTTLFVEGGWCSPRVSEDASRRMLAGRMTDLPLDSVEKLLGEFKNADEALKGKLAAKQAVGTYIQWILDVAYVQPHKLEPFFAQAAKNADKLQSEKNEDRRNELMEWLLRGTVGTRTYALDNLAQGKPHFSEKKILA